MTKTRNLHFIADVFMRVQKNMEAQKDDKIGIVKTEGNILNKKKKLNKTEERLKKFLAV